jgi:hypothetical protein
MLHVWVVKHLEALSGRKLGDLEWELSVDRVPYRRTLRDRPDGEVVARQDEPEDEGSAGAVPARSRTPMILGAKGCMLMRVVSPGPSPLCLESYLTGR